MLIYAVLNNLSFTIISVSTFVLTLLPDIYLDIIVFNLFLYLLLISTSITLLHNIFINSLVSSFFFSFLSIGVLFELLVTLLLFFQCLLFRIVVIIYQCLSKNLHRELYCNIVFLYVISFQPASQKNLSKSLSATMVVSKVFNYFCDRVTCSLYSQHFF